MASLMSNPYMAQYMGQMGLGLMAAGQAQPPGANRYSVLMNAYNQANQNLMRNQMFGMQKKDREEKRAEKAAQKKAMSTLVGGLDPTTDITWNQGRQGMEPGEQMGLLAQASPDAFAGAMINRQFAAPKERRIVKGADDRQRYPDTGKLVFPGVKAKPDRPSIPAIVAPILKKLSKGETLTEGEARTLDIYRRMSPIDRLIEREMGMGGTPQPTNDKPKIAALKARVDKGETLSEEELQRLYEDDPETFRSLVEYLESK